MNLSAETKTLLDNVFGGELSADMPSNLKKHGLRSAMSMVMADEGLPELRPEAVRLLIRTALCKGIGELPFGWSILPTDAAQHELTVWVLDGLAKERVSA